MLIQEQLIIIQNHKNYIAPKLLQTCNVKQKIALLCDRLFEGILSNKTDFISLICPPNQEDFTSSQIETHFNFESLSYELIQDPLTNQSPAKPNHSLKYFTQFIQILEIILDGIQNQRYRSKREIYYSYQHLFDKQEHINLIVKKLAFILQVPRRQLHIISATKGLVSGPLILQSSIDQYCLHIGHLSKQGKGFNISEFMDYWDMVEVYGKQILVVEKETIYFKLIEEQNEEFLASTVLITGKGYPCQATQSFLKYVSLLNPQIPIYYLGDMDPHGFDILCQYAFGNEQNIFEYNNIPWIRWLNPILLGRKQENLQNLVELSQKEKIMLDNLLERKYFKEVKSEFRQVSLWQEWRRIMYEHRDGKYELESLLSSRDSCVEVLSAIEGYNQKYV